MIEFYYCPINGLVWFNFKEPIITGRSAKKRQKKQSLDRERRGQKTIL